MPFALIVKDTIDADFAPAHLLIREGFEVLEVSSNQVMLEVRKQIPSLILLCAPSLRLTEMSVIAALRNLLGEHWVPILFMADNASEDEAIKAVDAGIDEYLPQAVSANLFCSRVNAMSRIAGGQRQLHALVDQLTRLSQRDSLTGLFNRQAVFNQAEFAWQLASRSQKPMSVMMIDVDHFKLYNDSFGHVDGDNCLIVVADIMKSALQRECDLLGRYGGEEFIAVLPETNLEEAQIIASRLCAAFTEKALSHPGSPTVPYVTASIGLASCVDARYFTLKALVEVADDYLYQAKDAGRNRVECGEVGSTVRSITHQL